MRNLKLPQLIIVFLIVLQSVFSIQSYASWSELNVGISDDIHSVWFRDSVGAIATDNGIYLTNSYGLTASDWSRFTGAGNLSDSTILSNTIFKYCAGRTYNNDVFAVGRDTVNNRGVVFKIDALTLVYSMAYQGPVGSSFNYIHYNSSASRFHILGDNGLYLTLITSSGNVYTHPLGTSLNLKSISTFGSKATIVTDHALIRTYHSSTSITSVYIQTDSSKYFMDCVQESTYTHVVGDDIYNFINYNNSATTPYTYGFGPIAANCNLRTNYKSFIGTDHGVFLTTSTYGSAEWQPSSLNYNIKSLSQDQGVSNTFYACGSNGVLLKNTGVLFEVKPHVEITSSGGSCVSENFYITSSSSSANSCSWYVNGQHIHNTCGSPTINIDSTGVFTITKIGTNSYGFSDTSTINHHITLVPLVNIPLTINDSILCKSEQISINLSTSEPDVIYTLRNIDDNLNYGTSPIGTGGAITFQSDFISQTGTYYIEASNVLAPSCTANFTDTIPIIVEQTLAKFHQNKVNIELGEEIQLFERCRDAQIYNWSFPSNGSMASSSASNPTLNFTSSTQGQIQLIASSIHGCYDTIQEKGPFVYAPNPVSDSCWFNMNLGPDVPWAGSYHYEDISEMAQSQSGYLLSGNTNLTNIATQFGDSLEMDQEGFVTKYNDDGILKWIVTTQGSDRTNVLSVIEDQDENVYFIGIVGNDGYLIDNTGDTIPLHLWDLVPFNPAYSFSSGNAFLVKLDSLGKFQWVMKTGHLSPYNLQVDRNNNIVMIGADGPANPYPLYLNDIVLDSVPNVAIPYSFDHKCAVVTLDENGSLQSSIQIGIRSTNIQWNFISDVEFDQANNMLVSGNYEYEARFITNGGASYKTLDKFGSGQRRHAFLAKYDPSGELIWNTRSYQTGTNGSVYYNDLAIPENSSDIYLAGSNDATVNSYVQVYENPDSSEFMFSAGDLFLGKVDSNGYCQWLNGAAHSYYGGASKIIISDTSMQILGSVANNNFTIEDITLTSTDNRTLDLSLYRGDRFIADYNLDGGINYALVSGVNGTLTPYSTYMQGFFRKDDGSYFLAQDIGYNQTPDWQLFGSEIGNSDGYAGLVVKFQEPCAIYYPSIASSTYVYDTICAQSDYTFADGTQWLDLATDTSYVMYLLDVFNLDSLVTMFLSIHSSSTPTTQTIEACDSAYYQNTWYYNSTQWVDTLVSSFGCDSFHYNNIIINTTDTVTSQTIEDCGAVYFQNIWNFNSTQYIDTLASTNACDSFHYTNIIVHPVVVSNDTVSGCDGVFYQGLWYSNSTQLIDTFTTAYGCDSLHFQYIEIHPSGTITYESISACDSLLYNGNWHYASTQWVDTLVSSLGCDSILTVQIEIVQEISGVVYASNSTPLASAKLYRIVLNPLDSTLQVLDSTYANNLGEFSFATSNANTYLKAIPPLSNFPNEVPTYYFSSPVFQFANTTSCSMNLDFYTLPGVNPGGNGFISGFIGLGAGKVGELGQVVTGLTVFLINANGEVVAYTTTDINGYFEFGNVPCGEYKLWVDDGVTNNLLAPLVDLTSPNCQKDSLIFKLANNKLIEIEQQTTGIGNLEYQNVILNVSPNPADNYFNVKLQSEFKDLQLEIVDLLGQTLFTSTIESEVTRVETAHWSSGVYMIYLKDENKQLLGVKKVVVAK